MMCVSYMEGDGVSMSVSVPGYLYTAQTIQTTLTTYDTTIFNVDKSPVGKT